MKALIKNEVSKMAKLTDKNDLLLKHIQEEKKHEQRTSNLYEGDNREKLCNREAIIKKIYSTHVNH